MHTFKIDGQTLTNQVIIEALSEANVKVELDQTAAENCLKTRQQVERWLKKDAPVIYGINTGLGNLKDTVLSPDEHISWNRTIPYPHAVGMGGFIDPTVTRTALLIRANVLARGYSAVRVELIERILSVYNAGIAPAVYELGSTGLSDLASLSQIAMVVAGRPEAQVFYKNEIMSANEAFKRADLEETFELQCKEVLSQMNGSTVTQALAVITFENFESFFSQYCQGLNKWNAGLYLSMVETMSFIKDKINFENNISCDNPLLFKIENNKIEVESNKYEAVMGCNCSNTQIGYVMDLLVTLMCDISSWYCSTQDLTNISFSLSAQIDQLRIPASADSIPTKGNQEDHVEFSYGAARKANKALKLLIRLFNVPS